MRLPITKTLGGFLTLELFFPTPGRTGGLLTLKQDKKNAVCKLHTALLVAEAGFEPTTFGL
jgi:hypothetical protein